MTSLYVKWNEEHGSIKKNDMCIVGKRELNKAKIMHKLSAVAFIRNGQIDERVSGRAWITCICIKKNRSIHQADAMVAIKLPAKRWKMNHFRSKLDLSRRCLQMLSIEKCINLAGFPGNFMLFDYFHIFQCGLFDAKMLTVYIIMHNIFNRIFRRQSNLMHEWKLALVEIQMDKRPKYFH